MKDQHFKQVFKNKNFLKLWATQMLSQFTIQIMNFYILTRIYAITHSTIAVSLMWVAGSLPALMFGPFSGAIVDSFSRRKIMIITNILQAIVVALLLINNHRIFYLYTIVFLYWLLDQFYFPSQQASAPALIAKESLPAANGLFLLTQQASVLIGFGLGGIMLTFLGPKITILIAVVNLVLATFAVYYLPKDKPHTNLMEKDFSQFWKDFVDGYHFIRSQKNILAPLIVLIIVQVYISVISTLLPSYTSEVLHLNLNQSSSHLIVPGAVGAVITTYLLPNILKRVRKNRLVLSGLSLAGLCLFGMSAIDLIPWAKSLAAITCAIGLGVAIAMILVPTQSVVQEKTPASLQGRVYGHLGFLLILATTVPLILSATIADLLGVGVLMGILGLLLLAGVTVIYVKKLHVMANGARV